ncbi:hypothetical protein AtNW77_Chr5g0120081 [Arabidopsis thaliana]
MKESHELYNIKNLCFIFYKQIKITNTPKKATKTQINNQIQELFLINQNPTKN